MHASRCTAALQCLASLHVTTPLPSKAVMTTHPTPVCGTGDVRVMLTCQQYV